MELPERGVVQVSFEIFQRSQADRRNLLDACEAIKWPSKVQYTSLSMEERRRFERAYSDLLYLQIECVHHKGQYLTARGENLHGPSTHTWSSGESLYPLQAMIKPIALRFKYHFQGSKTTNRIDKVRPSSHQH